VKKKKEKRILFTFLKVLTNCLTPIIKS